MRVRVVLEPSEEGGYTVIAPALQGCIREGETGEDAPATIPKAIQSRLERDAELLAITL